jgi:hypothetical protein
MPEVHYQLTKNKSFLRMHKFLKDQGIRNNKFFLVLYDQLLENVDPYHVTDPNLRARIIRECKINPWYFLREVARLNVPGGTIQYELHRGNLALTYCLLNNLSVVELLPRQNGKTVGVNFVMAWTFFFGTKNSDIVYANKKLSDAEKNLQRFEDIIRLLPPWLIEQKHPKKDHENFQNFTRKEHLNNAINVIPSANSEEDADKLGRGLTIPILWCDEFAFLDYNWVMYAAAAPALSAASEAAAKNASPHWKCITTTPNSIDLPAGQYCKTTIINGAVDFDEKIFYDLPVSELADYVDKNSENDFVHIEFTWQQLGRDQKWYRKQCRELNNDRLKIKREIDLEWTLSSDKSPFTEEELETVDRYIVKEEQEMFMPIFDTGNHKLTLLETVDFYAPVILSCDVGAGSGDDFSTMTVLDAFDGHTIGYFRSNRIVPLPFARIVGKVSERIFPNSTIVVERNSYGLDVITTLLENPITKPKVFYTVVRDNKPDGSLIKGPKEKREYGVSTNVSSRDSMISNLFLYVAEEPSKLRSRWIHKQLKTLERKKNGKVEHTQGEHDDDIFSYLIGRYAMTFASINLFRRKRYAHQERGGENAYVRPTVVTERVRTLDDLIKESNNKARKIFSLNRL